MTRPGVDRIANHGCAREINHEAGSTQRGGKRVVLGHPAFKPARRVGRTGKQRAGSSPHVGLLPVCCFEEDGSGLVANLRGRSADDAGKAIRMASVVRVTSHDHHVWVECHRLAFGGKCLQCLTRFRRPRDQVSRWNMVVIKCVQGLSPLDHHEIRDIDHVVDGPDASCLETLLHPCG